MDIKELYELYRQHPCITTDSRDCPEGSIFLALRGESFNGNNFARQAIEKGCAYAIVDEGEADDRIIRVDDCLQTFKALAREHRRQFDIPVIAITGTNGKTTTKELVAAVLARRYKVLATAGNFNNDVGVPKTLFRLTPEHEIAVVEMGASHPGDIKTLVETAEPTCGVITNVGRAHLQGFGSFDGVKRTKGELYDYLRRSDSGDTVFINADNDDLAAMAAERDLTTLIKYGQSDRRDLLVRGEVVSCAPLLKFRWCLQDIYGDGEPFEWHEVQTQLIGSYNLDNMLAAATIGFHFGISEEQICQALESYVPSNNRSQLQVTAHNRLIVDAYNANPTSMAAALRNFKMMEAGSKMAILGKMGELGDVSQEEHQKVVDYLREAGFQQVWLVGEEYDATNDCPFRRFKDVEAVKAAIAEQQPQGYCILIKGSNSNRLFQLPPLL